MPVLLLIIGLLVPRITILLLWLFSDWLYVAFANWVIPLLGFIFLPYTLLWYLVVHNLFDGRWGLWQVLFLVIALLFDLSSYSMSSRDED